MGTPGGSLEGISLVVLGDGAGDSGTIEAVVNLTVGCVLACMRATIRGLIMSVGMQSVALGSNGLLLVTEDTFDMSLFPAIEPGTTVIVDDLNFENSDNVNFFLVSDFTGSLGDDLDEDDDGMLDIEPWSEVVDCIALVESFENGELIYCENTVRELARIA